MAHQGLLVWAVGFQGLILNNKAHLETSDVVFGVAWSVRLQRTLGVVSQRLQNPLIKEYSLNHIRDPSIV